MLSEQQIKTYAIILSGGIGARLKGLNIPKQYHRVRGRTILSYCLDRMEQTSCVNAYLITAAAEWQESILQERNQTMKTDKPATDKFLGFALPGENRQLSILHGLQMLKQIAREQDIILIQDAVRPLTSETLISRCIESAKTADGAMPMLPMTDTVYYSRDGAKIDALLERDKIIAGQAPEAFVYGAYLRANEALSYDEILAVNGSTEPAIRAGMKIALLDGEAGNFKITTAEDLRQFEKLMEDCSI